MNSFSELPISAPILKAINELGFTAPSPIQAETLPILLGDDTDFMGLAATGTGKTAAFSIPVLEKIDADLKKVQCLVLCPTRELALQVTQQINLLGKFKGIRAVPIYGGASYIDQIQGIKRGAQVIVGTPGRTIDHLERGTLTLADVHTIILDEADEMISMGFKEDLEKILDASPRETCKIWLFSATMSREVRKVADTYLRQPKQVEVNRKEMLPSTVEQYFYPVHEGDKPEVICKLIEAADDFYGLIFCQTKALTVDLTQYLHDRGYKVDSLHGDKDQNSRERTMQAYRERKARILVCTDVASRGLDVRDITHVINYSLPRELDNYVHRIGRTARSGKTGIAMNLVTKSHRGLITKIEQFTKTKMTEGKLPTRREIGAKKVSQLLSNFQDQPYHSRAMEILSEEWKQVLETATPAEVAGRFLAMMMPDVFNDRDGSGRVASIPKPTAISIAPATHVAPAAPKAKPRMEDTPYAPRPRISDEKKFSRKDDGRNDHKEFARDERKEKKFARAPREERPLSRETREERAPAPAFKNERKRPFRKELDAPPSGENRKARRLAKFGLDYQPMKEHAAYGKGGDRSPRKSVVRA